MPGAREASLGLHSAAPDMHMYCCCLEARTWLILSYLVLTCPLLSFCQQQHSSAGQAGGEALVGRLVAKRFGSFPKLFRGKIGYYAPRLCPQA